MTKTNKIHSVKYNFVMNFILSASQIIFPFITFPYISRILLAEGNGKITFATSVANYFLLIASLGIPTYGIRACAQVRDDKEELSQVAQEILIINAITTAAVTVTYLLCINNVPRLKMDRVLFLINGINIVLNLFGMNWLFQALEQYDYITIRSLAFKAFSIVLMFLLVHKKDDYIIYGGITVLAASGSNILNFIRAHRYISLKRRKKYNFKRHIKPILILFAQSLAVSIYTNLDTVMLGFMKTDVDVGYYNAAVKIKTILLSLVSSLGNVLLPRMSYYAKESMKKQFVETMKTSLNFTLMLAVPLAIYFSLFSDACIAFLAGDGYVGAILAMQIITIAIIPNGLTGILGVQVLTAIEKEKYVLCSVVIGALLDFSLNLLLIPQMGAAGAALATCIAEFVVLLVQLYFTKELLLPVRKKIYVLRYILICLPAIAISSVVRLMNINSTFIVLLISASFFFGVYLLELYLSKDEFMIYIITNLKKKINKC